MLTLFFLLLFILPLHAEELAEEPEQNCLFDPGILSDLEQEPYGKVHGVNVITGDYTEAAEDMAFEGAHSLSLQRSYCSTAKKRECALFPAPGWRLNHLGGLKNLSDRSMYH